MNYIVDPLRDWFPHVDRPDSQVSTESIATEWRDQARRLSGRLFPSDMGRVAIVAWTWQGSPWSVVFLRFTGPEMDEWIGSESLLLPTMLVVLLSACTHLLHGHRSSRSNQGRTILGDFPTGVRTAPCSWVGTLYCGQNLFVSKGCKYSNHSGHLQECAPVAQVSQSLS